MLRKIVIYVLCCCSTNLIPSVKSQASPNVRQFKAELFLNKNELNSGLYEGQVIGRKRFGRSQIPHGFGIINYFTNDKFQRLNYTGKWENGSRSGNGTTYFRDGSLYQGEYKDGVEHGTGTIRYPNGNILVGEFAHGKIHGHAVFKYPNGNQREGFFRENILDGQVIFTAANGKTVIETWRNGERIEEEDQVVLVTEGDDTKASSSQNTEETKDKVGDNKPPSSIQKQKKTTVRFPDELPRSFDLESLRKSIRKGERSFSFNQNSNDDERAERDTKHFQTIREKSAKEDLDFRRVLFNSVHS